MEVGTGAILYAKNIDAHEYPASITVSIDGACSIGKWTTDG